MTERSPSLEGLERKVDGLEGKVDDLASSLEGDQGIRVRMAVLETQGKDRHEAVMAAIAGVKRDVEDVKRDVSDQGKDPPEPPGRPWTLRIAPGSGRELGYLIGGILATLGLVGAGSFARESLPEPDPVVVPARVEEVAGAGEPAKTP
jgi:hypothetical protein